MSQNRFQDDNKTISEFQKEVLVVCPRCESRASAKVDHTVKLALLLCDNCGYNKQMPTEVSVFGHKGNWQMSANAYFDAELWLTTPFKNEVFWAYNIAHLEYLEKYISATLREHKDRTHFTLLEKLPRFYHESKNRESLLKVIQKLRNKDL